MYFSCNLNTHIHNKKVQINRNIPPNPITIYSQQIFLPKTKITKDFKLDHFVTGFGGIFSISLCRVIKFKITHYFAHFTFFLVTITVNDIPMVSIQNEHTSYNTVEKKTVRTLNNYFINYFKKLTRLWPAKCLDGIYPRHNSMTRAF